MRRVGVGVGVAVGWGVSVAVGTGEAVAVGGGVAVNREAVELAVGRSAVKVSAGTDLSAGDTSDGKQQKQVAPHPEREHVRPSASGVTLFLSCHARLLLLSPILNTIIAHICTRRDGNPVPAPSGTF